MNLLIPGRFHLLTRYQHEYLSKLVREGLVEALTTEGKPLGIKKKVTAIIFAVTSANHSNTRRNPLPLYQRSMMIQDFTKDIPISSLVVPIDDIGENPDFAQYTLKKIALETEGKLELNPENSVILCSTPVANMYSSLGFQILPVERIPGKPNSYFTKLPWEVLENLTKTKSEIETKEILDTYIHPASKRLWEDYGLLQKVKTIFSDQIIGDDGDITESRDYNTYVREMDAIAELKFNETKPFVLPGRIGDIGCAVGSWIALANKENHLSESDFYGVEIARKLYQICEQRKENGDFKNPNVFFMRKNAVSGLVFPKSSMNTIHTSSLTHEIESYGNRESLLQFIRNRYEELCMGGVWINRDVVGPKDKDKIVYAILDDQDGINDLESKSFSDPMQKKEYLDSLSTFARFYVFQREFRSDLTHRIQFDLISIDGQSFFKIKLSDLCEYASKKDYTDNWDSEMHESFCFWSYEDWSKTLKDVGFRIKPGSVVYRNEWLYENRYKKKIQIFTSDTLEPISRKNLFEIPFPETHFLIIAEK